MLEPLLMLVLVLTLKPGRALNFRTRVDYALFLSLALARSLARPRRAGVHTLFYGSLLHVRCRHRQEWRGAGQGVRGQGSSAGWVRQESKQA